MGDRYVTREKKTILGEKYSVTTREKTVAEENADFNKGVDTAAGVAGLLIGSMLRQHQATQNSQIETAASEGMKAIDSGDYEKGLEIGQRLIKMGGKEAPLIGLFITGISLRFLDRYDDAIEKLTKALDGARALGYEQQMGQLYIHRGCCYLGKEDLANSIRDFTTFIKIDSREDIGYFYRAIALKKLGDYNQALDNLNQAVSINPSDAANYRERGDLYATMKQLDKAIDDYSRALTLDPKSSYGYKLRGKAYMAIGNPTKAIEDFSQAIILRQTDVEARQLRANAYKELGEESKAEADIRDIDVLNNSLKSFNSYLQAAQDLYQQGMTIWYTPKDILAKTNFKFILFGVGVLVITFMCLMLSIAARVDRSGCGIILGIVVSVILLVQAFLEPRRKAKKANALFEKLADIEKNKPTFSLFYEQYLTARKNGTLNDLNENTILMFQRIK